MRKIFSLLFLFIVVISISIYSYAEMPTGVCPECGAINWQYKLLSPSNCETEGQMCWICNGDDNVGCGYMTEIESIPASHTYSPDPRTCAVCGNSNPYALQSFNFEVARQLYIYDSPSSTTFIPVITPATASGTIIYSVYPEGIIGLGPGKDSYATCSFSSRLAIYPITVGKATLTFQIRDVDGSCFYKTESVDITVDWQKTTSVTSIQYSPSTLYLVTGSSHTIQTNVLPVTADQTVTWTTNNPYVADVDASGKVSAYNIGTATITVSSKADPSIKYDIPVTVTSTSTPEPSDQPLPSPSPTPSWTPVSIYTTYYSPGYYSTGLCYEDTNYAGFLEHTRGALYTRTGYSQTGWSLDYYGRTLDYNLYEAYTNSCDLNLYPYWTVNPSAPLKLTINYDSSLGTVYFNGKVFPSGHYWSIYEGETLNFSFVPISNYYASSIKLAGRYLGIYNNAFSVSYSDMYAANQSAYVNFTSIYGKPKTGDEANTALWLALGLLSMTGLGLAGAYAYRKKHKI